MKFEIEEFGLVVVAIATGVISGFTLLAAYNIIRLFVGG